MMNCRFCNQHPPIQNSHVVSKFIVQYIKMNSPSGFLLNSWSMKRAQDGIKGPYLCHECDNVLFSDWENHFKLRVFDCNPPQALALSDEKSIKFILSIAFRYAIHFLETSPISANVQNNEIFKRLTYNAINNTKIVGEEIFIYPYSFKPVTNSCQLIPGVNHFLNLSSHAVSLPAEEGLPNAFLLILPSMLFLQTDGNLKEAPANELINLEDLRPLVPLNLSLVNTNMPLFVAPIINRGIGQTQAHQRNMNLWNKIAYGADKLLHPNKMIYRAQKWDSNLLAWQRKNCANKQFQPT